MKITHVIRVGLLCIALVSCNSTKPIDRVISKPVTGPAQGPVYYLPLTALGITAPITFVEYEQVPPGAKPGAKGNQKFYAAEIRETVTLSKVVLPDPDQRYCIQAKDLSSNPFILSNLTFQMSEAGLLTSVSADVKDETLDAVAAGVKVLANIARLGAGVRETVRAAEAAKPDKSSLVEVKVLGKHNQSFVFVPIPGDPDSQKYAPPMPSQFDGKALDYVDTIEIKVGGEMRGSGSPPTPAPATPAAPTPARDAGVYYRTPRYMEVTSTVRHSFGVGQLESRSSDFVPLMQFGHINSLIVEAKRFTNRTTTAELTNGNLTKYGVKSESSAKKVLDTLNGAVTEARDLQADLATLRAQQEKEKLAKQKQAFDQLKKLQAYSACAQKPGAACADELNALIASFVDSAGD